MSIWKNTIRRKGKSWKKPGSLHIAEKAGYQLLLPCTRDIHNPPASTVIDNVINHVISKVIIVIFTSIIINTFQ